MHHSPNPSDTHTDGSPSLWSMKHRPGRCSGISLKIPPFHAQTGQWWLVPECPTRISDVLRLRRSNSAPSVASSALLLLLPLLLYYHVQSLHGKLCAGGRSDFQLVMVMMRDDITWLHRFHNHAALWGLHMHAHMFVNALTEMSVMLMIWNPIKYQIKVNY